MKQGSGLSSLGTASGTSIIPRVPRVPVSAIITSFNEVDFIEECVRSVDWADEIYLVDSYSTDGTLELVRSKFPKVRIEQREYLGAASQKNYAIDRADHDWIFYIDADERVTPALRVELQGALDGPLERWAYSVGRRNFMMGEEVRYSGLQAKGQSCQRKREDRGRADGFCARTRAQQRQ